MIWKRLTMLCIVSLVSWKLDNVLHVAAVYIISQDFFCFWTVLYYF